jgi:hypothetical protein
MSADLSITYVPGRSPRQCSKVHLNVDDRDKINGQMLGWARGVVREYGSDRVMIDYGNAPEFADG